VEFLKKKAAVPGAFPTMITPYTEKGTVDFEAIDALTEWYWKNGCAGIFASCQSSEIHFMAEDERVAIADRTKKAADALAKADKSRAPMTVIASGHVSDSFEAQVRELTRIAETGVDGVIWITNRLDIANTGDDAWLADAERLLKALPQETVLGLYECPNPYKRLLTTAMLKWCLSTGRFRYIKDTCCDAAEIARRMELLRGTPLKLYNANAQTLLPALRCGAAGYCGVMANFHPALYAWLIDNFEKYPEMAEKVAANLSIAAFTEYLAYPITAKYHLSAIENIPMSLLARSRKAEAFSDYDVLCVRQMDLCMRQLMDEVEKL